MWRELFARRGYLTEGAEGREEALERVRAGLSGTAPRVNLVLTDVRLGRGLNGIDLLKELKSLDGILPVILMTGYSSVPDAVAAMKLGASDYVTKPFERPELIEKVEAALRTPVTVPRVEPPRDLPAGSARHLKTEAAIELPTGALPLIPGLRGQSRAMRRLIRGRAPVGSSMAA